MRGRVCLALAGLLVAALGVAAPSLATSTSTSGSFTKHTYPKAGAPGARDYWVYVPAGAARRNHPVVVFLHGCIQTARQAASGSRLNELAQRRGFVAVYPEQLVPASGSAPVVDGNGMGCWNWFLPEHQERGAGEPATIAGLTRRVVAEQRADRTRVYVAGLSAGADMTAILGATYPDVYAAAAAVAGCAYRACADVTGLLTHRAMGRRARVLPMFVSNGSVDPLNNLAMARTLVSSWLGAQDLADDGAANGSIPRQPRVEHHGLDQQPEPGSGDPCVHPNTWFCPGGVVGFSDGYPYTVEQYADARGCVVLASWTLHGQTHTQPKGRAGEPYQDPLGPDLTRAAYDFLSRHRLGRAPCR